MEIDSGERGELPPLDESKAIVINPIHDMGYFALARVLFREMPRRSILSASLMITQSFLYNAIFFTYALVLATVYHVASGSIPLYFIAFAIGNLAGPLSRGVPRRGGRTPLLGGHRHPAVGRRPSGGAADCRSPCRLQPWRGAGKDRPPGTAETPRLNGPSPKVARLVAESFACGAP